MDNFQLMVVMMSITDTQWQRNGRREATAEELDVIADYGWHLDGLKRSVVAAVKAVSARWRSGSMGPAGNPSLTPAETK